MRERFDGPLLTNIYGQSETSGACVISPADDSFEQVATTIGGPRLLVAVESTLNYTVGQR